MPTINDFQAFDIRIAEILEAKPHPNADRLLLLTVSVGDVTKQIVAGIRMSYSAEELVGRKVVVLNNLEPAVIRGERSEGMLLAASSDAGPIFITPEKNAASGAKVG